ncbi:CAP domain-containing protein [Paracoccus sp. NBH48]|nr:CAP domain-containing protein [Paracoccus sp. NBH48]
MRRHPAPRPPPRASQAIASSVSQMRAQAGLGAVTVDPALTAAATRQACEMAARGRLSHRGGGGVKARARSAGYAASVVAENIAAGQRDAGAAMRSWARSAGTGRTCCMRGCATWASARRWRRTGGRCSGRWCWPPRARRGRPACHPARR